MMAESEEHSRLVSILHAYIADQYCDGNGERISTDSRGYRRDSRPPNIGGYIPDAYVMLEPWGVVVIGEAKSIKDLENDHTRRQLTAFLRKCSRNSGSALVLAVPWVIAGLARTFLANIKEEHGLSQIDSVVISEIDGLGLPDMVINE